MLNFKAMKTVRSSREIGHIVRNAVAFNPRNWHDFPATSMDDILQSVGELFTLLQVRRIDYVLVGGIAMLQYVEGRNTEDIDLIVALSDLQKLPEIVIESQDDNFARGQFRGLQIDFLLSRNLLFDLVRKHHATTQSFGEQEVVCVTVEGLLLLKLYALPALYRLGRFARVGLYENDIATLMQSYKPDMTPIFAELKNHLSDQDLQSVSEIVREIEVRIARFEQGSS